MIRRIRLRKIAVVTGTRAEYGLLRNIIKKIDESSILQLQLIVTGAHLSEKYGATVSEILKDGFTICKEIPILCENNEKNTMVEESGKLMIELSTFLSINRPDILLVLGDRYEILAAVTTAMLLGIPVAHISGGEITEGAIDDQIRHAITKMSQIHFPGTQVYADNIAKMGEELFRIHMVGDPGIENIRLMKLLDKAELSKALEVPIEDGLLLVTYHPVTMEVDKVREQIDSLIEALTHFDKQIIFTYPNTDNGGNIIIEQIEKFSKENENVFICKNMGSLRYLSAMNLCGAVIGNSSSAIVEAPYLKKPVVNIGNRQKGRLMSDCIINSNNSIVEIEKAIKRALSAEFSVVANNCESLYGDGNTSEEIVKVLENIVLDKKLITKKLVWEK